MKEIIKEIIEFDLDEGRMDYLDDMIDVFSKDGCEMVDTGGNCGAQVSTLIIRGLALGEIQLKDIFKVLWKEIRVGLIVGVVLCLFTVGRVLLVNQATLAVALVVGLALFFTVILAKMIGCCLPLLAKKIGLDPALMASPLITTLVDAASLTIYFSIASAMLKL